MRLSLFIRPLAVGFVALLFCAGCKQYYVLTLNNAVILTSYTRPKLNDRGYYVITDSAGHVTTVNAMRVRQIDVKSKKNNHVMFDDSVPQKQQTSPRISPTNPPPN